MEDNIESDREIIYGSYPYVWMTLDDEEEEIPEFIKEVRIANMEYFKRQRKS